MKKISVIVPSYNYSEYLDVCLLSIITQRTNCQVDVLISDDFSSDDSFGVISRIKSKWESDRIKIYAFKQEENIGETVKLFHWHQKWLT